jgi:hypothetical protein
MARAEGSLFGNDPNLLVHGAVARIDVLFVVGFRSAAGRQRAAGSLA